MFVMKSDPVHGVDQVIGQGWCYHPCEGQLQLFNPDTLVPSVHLRGLVHESWLMCSACGNEYPPGSNPGFLVDRVTMGQGPWVSKIWGYDGCRGWD